MPIRWFSPKYISFATVACSLAVACWARAQFFSSCAESEKIATSKRGAIEEAALSFTRAALGNDMDAAYDQFTAEAQQNLTREQFRGTVQQVLQPLGSFKNLRVQHTYFVHLVGTSPQRIICGDDISSPQGWVAVAAKDVPEQGHVLVEGQALNNAWVFAVWLIPEQGKWRVQSFYANASTLADKSAEDIWALARAEKARGHSLNAAVLWAAATALASRGPNFQLGILPTIQEEMQQLSVPQELQGQPPFLWKAGEKAFRVLMVGPIAIGGKIYLVIDHEVQPWINDEQVEGWNRELMRYVVGRFPEYSEIFAGLLIRGREQGSNRLFGTVKEVTQPKSKPSELPKRQ